MRTAIKFRILNSKYSKTESQTAELAAVERLEKNSFRLKMGDIRGVFQKYTEGFHRVFAIAASLMIFHVKHAWYMLIRYR